RQIVRLDDAVAVVARPMGAAEKRLGALAGERGKGPHAKRSTKDNAEELERAAPKPRGGGETVGEVRRAHAEAGHTKEATYQVPFLAHATMEPMNCTADMHKDGCEIWVGTQTLARAQAAAAKTAGLPLDKVIVHNHLLGGGFGRRLEVDGVVRAVQIAQ